MGLITIPHVFKNDTQGNTSDIDSCFNTIASLVNGNLDEKNVNTAANSLLVNGIGVNSIPTPNTIPVLGSNARMPFASKTVSRGALVGMTSNWVIGSSTNPTPPSFNYTEYDTDGCLYNGSLYAKGGLFTAPTKARFNCSLRFSHHINSYWIYLFLQVTGYKNSPYINESYVVGMESAYMSSDGYLSVSGQSPIIDCTRYDLVYGKLFFTCHPSFTDAGKTVYFNNCLQSWCSVELID